MYTFLPLEIFHSTPSCLLFSFKYPCFLWVPLQEKQFRKWTIKALKTPVFKVRLTFKKVSFTFQKVSLTFLKVRYLFFRPLLFLKWTVPLFSLHSDITRSSVSGFSVIPLPSNPCHPPGRPVSQKTWHTYNVRVRVRAWWTTPWSPVNHAPSPLTARPTILYHQKWRSAPFSAKITCRVGQRTLSFSNDTPFRCPRAPPSHPFTFLSSPKRPIPQKNSPFFHFFVRRPNNMFFSILLGHIR